MMNRYNNLYTVLLVAFLVTTLVPKTQAQQSNVDTTDSLNIEGEIVLPFGITIEQERTTSSVTKIDPDFILKYDNAQSVLDALNGRVPGLMGNTNIRGYGDALVVVNGIPRSSGSLRLKEVESITVYRGGPATVLYGTQGANGVILINTKKGTTDTFRRNAMVEYGFGDPISYPNYLGSSQYMSLYNEALSNDGLPALFSQEEIDNHTNSNNSIEYPDQQYLNNTFLRSSMPVGNVITEFSGGSSTAQYYLNMGYERTGTLLNIGEGANGNDETFRLRARIDMQFNEIIQPYLETNVVFRQSHGPIGNFWQDVTSSSTRPHLYSARIPAESLPEGLRSGAKLIDGKYVVGGTSQYQNTPYGNLTQGGFTDRTERILRYNTGIDFNLNPYISGLDFRTNLSLSLNNYWNDLIQNQYAVYQPDNSNSFSRIGQWAPETSPSFADGFFERRYGFSGVLDYDPQFEGKHDLDLNGLIYLERLESDTTGIQTPEAHHFALYSNYMYSNKYIVELAGAYVGSSKLTGSNKWSFTPSVGLGWIISEERILQNSDLVNFLKLSSNWGIIKSDQNIGYNLYRTSYSAQGGLSFGDGTITNSGMAINSIANPNLEYEKHRQFNINIDARLFENSISLHAGYFNERHYDQILRPLNLYPAYLAENVAYDNFGSQNSEGFEFGLGYDEMFGDWNVGIGANLVYSTSEITKADEPLYDDAYLSRVGKPADVIFGYVAQGLFQSAAEIEEHADQQFGDVRPGDIKYEDLNNDGVINENDQRFIGNWNDRFQYGLNLNVAYKNLTLFVLGTGRLGGNSIFSNDYYWVNGADKYSEVVLDRWTPNNTDASYPRLTTGNASNNFRNSTFWLEDRNSFTINRIQLSYDFNLDEFNPLSATGVQLYLRASNLLTISNIKDKLTTNVGGLPQFRYYSAGLKLSFNK